ncbi:exported hypothetical protein [Flavobacterium psychrophilum]|uniref:tetratricopeptide repeat protein n=1 Tax=Flavobacterium psychrophilum TaxID=96345 RepID=UPI000B7C4A96|nr:tetratricopeptide repeat protein [Flavobacterium psychrophilum]SNB26254.1 exported hypothetical protein [Flavobacterium psychrophilum]
MIKFLKKTVTIALLMCISNIEAQTKTENQNRANIFCKQAESCMQQKNYNEAFVSFTKAININPIAKMYCQRAACSLLQKQYDTAIKDCDKALLLNKDYTQAYFLKATIYQFTDKTTDAIISYTKAINIDPNYTDAYLMRGLLYATLKKKSEACSDLHKAIELGSTKAKIHLKDICG